MFKWMCVGMKICIAFSRIHIFMKIYIYYVGWENLNQNKINLLYGMKNIKHKDNSV